MTEDILFFFDKRKDALPLYETLESRIFREIENVRVKVQKSQISFYNRHLFACVSFAGLRKKKDCPESYIVVTFGLDKRVESLRIEAASEPYPNRWTHHLLISDAGEIDDELMTRIKSAADFSETK